MTVRCKFNYLEALASCGEHTFLLNSSVENQSCPTFSAVRRWGGIVHLLILACLFAKVKIQVQGLPMVIQFTLHDCRV